MKKRTFLSLILGSALTFTTLGALASDIPPTNAIPAKTILKTLQNEGYTTVRKIEFDNGQYKVDALNSDKKGVDLGIDPKSGQVTKTRYSSGREAEAAGNMTLSALDVAEKVEAAGYHDIYKIEAKVNNYEVKAVDTKDKEVELEVNGKNGEVSKKSSLF